MKTTVAILAAAASLTGLAFANEPDGPGDGPDGGSDRHWEELDANGDGKVTLKEMNDRHKALFKDADANGDGALTKEELRAHHEKKMAKKMAEKMGDKNGDGVIDRSEYDAKTGEHFDKLDANKDGKLSGDELKAGHRGKGGH